MMYFNSTAGGSVTTPGEGSFPNTCCEDARNIVATPDGGCSFVEWTCVDYFAGTCTGYISDPYSPSTTIDLRCLQAPSITAHFSGSGQPQRSIYFDQSSYTATQDADGCQTFQAKILIEPPMSFFAGYQYRLAFNGSLIQPVDSWVQNNGRGELYDGANWTAMLTMATNPTGDKYCPAWAARTGIARGPAAGKHGCWDCAGLWNLEDGDGISFVETDPAGGNYLTEIRWVTSGTGTLARCFGKSVNTGTTEIVFWPKSNLGTPGAGLMCVGSEDGAEYDLEAVYDLIWVNSSVTVN